MDKIKGPELLSPVGGTLQLIAAVQNGADAIYMGGGNFNARHYANNFDTLDKIEEAINYCHIRGVKVYITLNILIEDEKIEEVLDFVGRIYKLGVDAVIIQDLGLAKKVYELFPGLPIHMSTQATIYSKEGIKALNDIKSIERIVPARELSFDEIREIKENTDKEIEVFVHGALCMCYSGQCQLSSQIGARSGNRGKCAQPCRLPYKLVQRNGDNKESKSDYYLSTKDLCLIENIKDLVEANVDSFKIEGRMKSPEYVAAVTSIYRKYIDIYNDSGECVVEKEDMETLLQVFNRAGFTQGYTKGKDLKSLWCNERPKHWGVYIGEVIKYDARKKNIDIMLEKNLAIGDGIEVVGNGLPGGIISFIRENGQRVNNAKKGNIVTVGDIKGNIIKGQKVYRISSKELNKTLKTTFENKEQRKQKVNARLVFKIGQTPIIELKTNIFNKEITVKHIGNYNCEKGEKRFLNKQDIINQFNKTGDTPFEIVEYDIELEESLMIQMSKINELRREVMNKLEKEIINTFKRKEETSLNMQKKQDYLPILAELSNKDTKISAYIYSIKELDNLDGFERVSRIYISLNDAIKYESEIERKFNNKEICIYLETITKGRVLENILENKNILEKHKKVLVSNIEHLELLKNINVDIWVDQGLNIFNSETKKYFEDKNVKGITYSQELTLEQILNLESNDLKDEVVVYGNVPVMFSEFCPVGAQKGIKACLSCKGGKYNLKDKLDMEFPMIFDNLNCTVRILNSTKLYSEEAMIKLNSKVDYLRLYILDESKAEREKIIENTLKILNKQSTKYKIVTNKEEKRHYTNGHFFRGV